MAGSPLSFVGRVAIITGSGGGIGKQYALALAKKGCNVVINDLAKNTAEEVAKEINQSGVSGMGKAIANNNSVTDGSKIVEQAINHFGQVDVLINNAGLLRDKSFHKMTKEEWKLVLDVHLQGTFELTHALWPHMQARQYGRVVNVGSAAGLYGNFGQANYSAAKMGILGLTNTLAKEGAKNNIRVNCVVPIADSAMTRTVLPPHLLELLDPVHIAPFVTYLAHESTEANGDVFEIGGGWYSKVRWQRNHGVFLGSKEKGPATVESIRDNFKDISSFDNQHVTYPTAPADTLRDIVEALSSPPTPVSTTTAAQPKATTTTTTTTTTTVNFKSIPFFESLQQDLTRSPEKVSSLAKEVDCSIQFHIQDSTGNNNENTKKWLLDLPKNVVRPLQSTDGRADVLVRCTDDVLLSIINKSLSPEFAYFKGKLDVKGSPILINKVKKLLEYK